MIVQNPEHPGGPAFVVLQDDHTAFAGSLAHHFGNSTFGGLDPLVIDLVARHDEGWTEEDRRFLPDPDKGLPRHLGRCYPIEDILETSRRSASIHESVHPFSGLISSMHSYGLYTGRYGLDDIVFLDIVPPEVREPLSSFLREEEKRQERLRDELRSDPRTAPLADEGYVWRIYRTLEFFDMFSLYVQCEHPSRHVETTFKAVPVDDDRDHDLPISVTPLGEGRYRVSPFPFDVEPFETGTKGRYLEPQPAGTDLAMVWEAASPAEQRVVLTS